MGRFASLLRTVAPNYHQAAEAFVDEAVFLLHLRFPEAVGGAAATLRASGCQMVFTVRALDPAKAVTKPRGAGASRFTTSHDG